MTFDRREFLSLGGAGLLAGLPGLKDRVDRSTRHEPDRARNVIFLVSDGMSAGTLTLAHVARLRRDGRASAWVDLWSRPGVRRATASTFAADSLVTDSAAGATAWSIGTRVNNGAINITPDGRAPVPILVHASQAGKAAGLVTTTRVTHATPAGFIANVPTRDMEGEIARQMLERRLDVALGGGARFFPQDLLAPAVARGLNVVRTVAELDAADAAAPILGLFADSHLPFELDRADHPTVPSLAHMTRSALARLDRAADGFVLQIEGGRVDHAAHSNDAGSLLADQLAFDGAIEAVLDFAGERDDTLVVITTDHANGNPGLTLYREAGEAAFERLLRVRRSFEHIEARAEQVASDDPRSMDSITAIIADATGAALSAAEAELLRRALNKERVSPFAPSNHPMLVLGGLLSNHLGVGFASGNHTADLVEVTAFGPGSSRLAPFIANTDLHALMVRALALPPPTPIPGQPERVEPVRPDADD